MFCGKCGSELPKGARFCPRCGAPVEGNEAAPAMPEESTGDILESAAETPVWESVPEIPVLENQPEEPDQEKEPIAPPPPQKTPAKDKTVSQGSAGRVALSVLLSILFFVFLFVSATVTVLRTALDEDRMADMLEELDPATVDVSALVGEEDETTLAEYLYDMCRDYPGWEGISRRDVEGILREDFIQDFLTGVVEDYRSALVEGKRNKGLGLSAANITDFIRENEDSIRDALHDAGMRGTPIFDYDDIEEEVENAIGDDLTIESLRDRFGGYFTAARIALSLVSLIVLWVLTAALAVLLIVLNKARIRVLLYIGIPALVFGVLYFAAALAGGLLLGSDGDLLFDVASELILRPMLVMGAISAGVGLLAVVARCVVGSVRKKQRKKLEAYAV